MMPRQPGIIRRVVHWVRNRTSSSEQEDARRLAEQHEQRLAEALEQSQRWRVITYNRWIERQREIAHNQRLQTETRDDSSTTAGRIVYRFSLLEIPEQIQSISRSLGLVIEENGMIFRLDVVQVYNEHVTWAVTALWPGQ